jgi:glyoxylase I family protein
VTGIGGLFFRAGSGGAGPWYQEHLGVTLTPSSYEELLWQQEAGPTVFAPFPEGTEYFGDPKRSWMVNFRVRNLDAMAAQLRAAGIAVQIDEQQYPNGRFVPACMTPKAMRLSCGSRRGATRRTKSAFAIPEHVVMSSHALRPMWYKITLRLQSFL